MGKPHKHAELIKLWADGAEIQVKDSGARWLDMANPTWQEWNTYRIKPKTTKYRNYLSCSGEIRVIQGDEEGPLGFLKWLGPWQEAEV